MVKTTVFQWLIISVLVVSSVAFTATSRNIFRSNTVDSQRKPSAFILYAKKDKAEAKGFSPKKVKPASIAVDSDVENFSEGLVPSTSSITGISKPKLTASQVFDGETDADTIFKKYGIKDGESQSVKTAKKKKSLKKGKKDVVEENPFGQSVLAGISADAQLKIDNTLVTCTALSLGFVVLSGISISLGAYTVVFPEVKIPESLDFVVTRFLSPAFTPALFVFFFFSITFGLFKFAQISSDQTVYKEEVTRDL